MLKVNNSNFVQNGDRLSNESEWMVAKFVTEDKPLKFDGLFFCVACTNKIEQHKILMYSNGYSCECRLVVVRHSTCPWRINCFYMFSWLEKWVSRILIRVTDRQNCSKAFRKLHQSRKDNSMNRFVCGLRNLFDYCFRVSRRKRCKQCHLIVSSRIRGKRDGRVRHGKHRALLWFEIETIL